MTRKRIHPWEWLVLLAFAFIIASMVTVGATHSARPSPSSTPRVEDAPKDEH